MPCCVLTILVVPAKAAVQVDDRTVIGLTVFVPCAAAVSARLWTLAVLCTL